MTRHTALGTIGSIGSIGSIGVVVVGIHFAPCQAAGSHFSPRNVDCLGSKSAIFHGGNRSAPQDTLAEFIQRQRHDGGHWIPQIQGCWDFLYKDVHHFGFQDLTEHDNQA